MWIDKQVMVEAGKDLGFKIFIPPKTVVVLGQNNKVHAEVHEKNCARDGIDILRRKGGGGTVVLHEGCVVVSIGGWVKDYYDNSGYFNKLNQSVIDALAFKAPLLARLEQNGISDIVWGDLKVAGTSLFRSRNYFLYQASLLVDPMLPLIEAYLQHPSQEPDYRGHRSHRQFVTGIQHIDPALAEIAPSSWSATLKEQLPHTVCHNLKDKLIPPDPKQVAYVQKKAAAL